MKYDYLIVGAGLTGAVFAQEASSVGKRCLVIDRRNHVAGNAYCEEIEGINVHRYGAHIFHTSLSHVWNYVNRYASFNNYVNSPIAMYGDEVYNMPFNMNTFSKMWGVKTPREAKEIIESQILAEGITEPTNLEEQALSQVGRDVYEKLVKGYTEKQWGRDCSDLPASIIKRLPCRFTYNNNYFNDRWQGIPIGGYTRMVERMLEGVEVRLGVDYRNLIAEGTVQATTTVYCGPIDEFFDFELGALDYRSLRFEDKILDEQNYQGVAVVNYTERSVPYTRVIEHKHFEFGSQPKTVITREYPADWKPGDEPYYPLNNSRNDSLYKKYREMAEEYPHLIFAGRLGEYKYYDMDKAIDAALQLAERTVSK